MALQPTLAEVLGMLRDPAEAVRRAGLALLRRLTPRDAEEAIPTVLLMEVDRRGPHYGIECGEIQAALAEVAPAAVPLLFAQLRLETPAERLELALGALRLIYTPHNLAHHRKTDAPPPPPAPPDAAAVLLEMLRHPFAETVRRITAELYSSEFLQAAAGPAAPTLCLWFTDQSSPQQWFWRASAALQNIGAPAVPELIRCLTDPGQIVLDAGWSTVPEWMLHVIRERAAGVLAAMGEKAASSAPALVTAYRAGPTDALARAIVSAAAGQVELLAQVEEASLAADGRFRDEFVDYFISIGAAGVPQLLVYLQSRSGERVLEHLSAIALSDPATLTAALPQIEALLDGAGGERVIRAAWLFGALGAKAGDLAPGVRPRLVSLADRLRTEPARALELAAVLVTIDAIDHDTPQTVSAMSKRLTWRSAA